MTPVSVCDALICYIQTNRRAINNLEFGEIAFTIRHYMVSNARVRPPATELTRPPDFQPYILMPMFY